MFDIKQLNVVIVIVVVVMLSHASITCT